jgi:hypothetical protein
VIILTLTPQQTQLVIDALAELPFKAVAQTYTAIMQQIQQQSTPPPPQEVSDEVTA